MSCCWSSPFHRRFGSWGFSRFLSFDRPKDLKYLAKRPLPWTYPPLGHIQCLSWFRLSKRRGSSCQGSCCQTCMNWVMIISFWSYFSNFQSCLVDWHYKLKANLQRRIFVCVHCQKFQTSKISGHWNHTALPY